MRVQLLDSRSMQAQHNFRVGMFTGCSTIGRKMPIRPSTMRDFIDTSQSSNFPLSNPDRLARCYGTYPHSVERLWPNPDNHHGANNSLAIKPATCPHDRVSSCPLDQRQQLFWGR
jgi:hypothetical protein